MKLLKLSPNNQARIAQKLSKKLHNFDLCFVYPTDTAYGLGVNALNVKAVKRLYDLKKRDYEKPTHVLVKDWEMIESLCHVNAVAKKLFDRFLPGPLTIILPKKDVVPDELTGGLGTLGVRIPNNQFTQLLSNYCDFPITTPSANRSSEPTPYSIDDVRKVLDVNMVDLVIDGGVLTPTPPSTIVDLSSENPKILRHGPIFEIDILETATN